SGEQDSEIRHDFVWIEHQPPIPRKDLDPCVVCRRPCAFSADVTVGLPCQILRGYVRIRSKQVEANETVLRTARPNMKGFYQPAIPGFEEKVLDQAEVRIRRRGNRAWLRWRVHREYHQL